MDRIPHIVVIGAGPSGLFAALTAADRGCNVTVLEYLTAPGRKLLASGGGRCNLTNVLTPPESADRFPDGQGRFVLPAMLAFTPSRLLGFFAENGVKCHAADGFHYFPESECASDVLASLIDRLHAGGRVKILCGIRGLDFKCVNGAVSGVAYRGGFLKCNAAIVAAGSPAAPALGGNGSIYPVLQSIGHSIVPPVPALVGLEAGDNSWCAALAGTVLDNAELVLDRKNRSCGELLFTHRGVSGPAVLDISGRCCRILADGQPVFLSLNWIAGMNAAEWKCSFDLARGKAGSSPVSSVLHGKITRAAAAQILKLADVDNCTCAALTAAKRDRLIAVLTGTVLKITDSGGFGRAMAASGGVSRKEIDRRTMQSRLIDNLYFAGEVIDVDGPCGGYNLQWAFSSGCQAGISASAAASGAAD